MHSTAPVSPADAPTEEIILCPMCGYDLRGLPEARCPECGLRFQWDELRDPTKRLHPYLFEHHPRHNLWSFLRTLLGGWRPGKFWRVLLPVQPSRPRRLIAYGIICSLLTCSLTLGLFFHAFMEHYRLMQSYRAQYTAIFTMPPPLSFPPYRPRGWNDVWNAFRTRAPLAVDIANNGSSWAKSIAREYGSINAYLDMSFPMPPDHRFFLNALNTILPRFTGFYAWLNPVTFTFSTTLALALWPWLTAIAFQIFQITMRRVRVRPMHVMRVAIYAGDINVSLAALLSLPMVASAAELLLGGVNGPLPGFAWMFAYLRWACVAAVLLLAVRLYFAVKYYLRFNHPFATVVSVQVIVALAMFKFYLLAVGY
jgi:hypothetical protein